MLRFDLRDSSDTYIVVKGTINVGVIANTNIDQKDAVLKNISPFRPCIIKINTLIDDAANLDIVMHRHNLYNLLEYSDDSFMRSHCGIIIEMKLIMLLMMLQKVKHLSTRQK